MPSIPSALTSPSAPAAAPNLETVYRPPATLKRFHFDDSLVRVVRGPVGSGKSTGCAWEGFRRAHEQKVGPSGKRRTKGLIVRNTYRELTDTTKATWLEWFPENIVGRFNQTDMVHEMRIDDVECDVLFRALDRPDDVKKILSLEITWAWVNELREIPLGIVNRIIERLGRFPPPAEGGATWTGLWADTNPPDEDHWLAQMEAEPPDDWGFFIQPAGLVEVEGKYLTNPEAENLNHLPAGYYERNLGAMKPAEIAVYRLNRFGFVLEGKPVIPEFDPSWHVRGDFLPLPKEDLFIGMDIGGGTLNPSGIFIQRHPRGPYLIHGEVVCSDLGVDTFGRLLAAELAQRFPEHHAKLGEEGGPIVYGDPAGTKRDELFETAAFDHLTKQYGFRCKPAPSQDPLLRINAIKAPCERRIDGKPGLMVHPRCRKLIKGLQGGWHYRRLQVSGREAYTEKPDKGEYSHPCEALGYGLMSMGELKTLQGKNAPGTKPQPIKYKRMANVA